MSLTFDELLMRVMEMNNSSLKTDRKIVERIRRNQMKALYTQLNSLVSNRSSKEVISLPDQLNEAVNYIKKLQIKLEKMKVKKDEIMGMERLNTSASVKMEMDLKAPHLEIHERGSALEVVLITGLDNQLMFNKTIRLLHEEGAEVVNASFFVLDERVFHTVHSKVGDSAPANAAAKISMRLKRFFNQDNAM